MRPSSIESRRRQDEFAKLIAADLAAGGLDRAHLNVVHHAKSCRLDPWKALRLQFDPRFVALVERLAKGQLDRLPSGAA